MGKINIHLSVTLVCAWIISLIVSPLLGQAEEPVVADRIVAVVNSDIITLYDLNRAFSPYEDNIRALGYPPEKERETLFQVRKDILNQLIDAKLADQEIKRNQIIINESDIDATIERMKEARHVTDEQLREGLAQQGLTMEEYRQEVKESILRARLVNREVKSKIVITKEDIEAYYDNQSEKYAGDRKYHLWNIFAKIPSSADKSEKETVRAAMDAMLTKLKQGDSFETLVNELKVSSSLVQGADLGLFRLDEIAEQLRNVVKKMKAGEHSGVLDTDFGYQIVYVQEIIETPAKPIEEVQSEIEQILYSESVDNKYQQWLEDLRTRSLIKIIN
jgi:peptidyl-prolyl cis-trans isomerase SurA